LDETLGKGHIKGQHYYHEGRKEGRMDGLINGWTLSVPSRIVLKSDMERMIQREFLLISFAFVNL
jgi:hypothetical protein